MLPPLVNLLIPLFLNFSAKADENALDFTWIKELNLQAEKLAQSSQIEAKAIIDKALKASSQEKHCRVAENLTHQAAEGVRQNLELSESDYNNRYPNLLVFVSFSMPLETLKTLATQVNHVGGKAVLRGLINGSFKETAEKVKDLQQEVIIDPTSFEEYQIKVVPTFVLRRNGSKDGCQLGSHQGEPYDQLAGNVSLDYVLGQFSSNGTVKTEALELLNKLRKAL